MKIQQEVLGGGYMIKIADTGRLIGYAKKLKGQSRLCGHLAALGSLARIEIDDRYRGRPQPHVAGSPETTAMPSGIMLRLIANRILQAAPVIVIVSVLAFLLINLLPGDPAVVIAGDQASPEAIAAVRHNLGLDRPLIEQLGIWFVHLLQGNFGASLMLNQSVLSAMGERLPVTLSLALLSLAITLPIGIFAGAVAAYYRRTWIDSIVMTAGADRRFGAGVLDRDSLDHPVQRHAALVSDRRLHALSCRIPCSGCVRWFCPPRCCRCSRSAFSRA